jgi:hypothetical protein
MADITRSACRTALRPTGGYQCPHVQPGEREDYSVRYTPSALTVVNGNPSGSAGDQV